VLCRKYSHEPAGGAAFCKEPAPPEMAPLLMSKTMRFASLTGILQEYTIVLRNEALRPELSTCWRIGYEELVARRY
jgi:hypothetical protein